MILLISGEFVSLFNKVGRNLKHDLIWNKEGDPIILFKITRKVKLCCYFSLNL